jgi:hypothetical protein
MISVVPCTARTNLAGRLVAGGDTGSVVKPLGKRKPFVGIELYERLPL